MTGILYIGSDNEVAIVLQRSRTGAYVNSGATVTFTLYRSLCKDAVTIASDATVTAASAPFVAGDAARSVVVLGAGANGADLRTTIASYTSTSSVELTVAPSVGISNAEVRISVADATTVTMSYVTDTNGEYSGIIDDDVVLQDGAMYWVEISADAGSDVKDFRSFDVIAKYRE